MRESQRLSADAFAAVPPCLRKKIQTRTEKTEMASLKQNPAHTPEEIADAARALRRAISTHASQKALARKHAPALARQKRVGDLLARASGGLTVSQLALQTGETADQTSTVLGRMQDKLWAQCSGVRWSLTRLGRRELIEGRPV